MPSRNRRRVRNYTVALLLLGVAAWIVPSYISAEHYRRRLRSGLEQTLHRPVRFGAVSFRLLPRPGFSIENAEVAEDPDFGSEPFARVDRIDCDLRWRSLWHTRMEFAQLHLDHPSFNVVVNSHGEWNVEKLLLQSGVTAAGGATTAGKPAFVAEQLDLDVDDARVNFQVGPDKKPFALMDVRARLQVNPMQRRVRFQITASPVRSDLTFPTPGPVEATGAWTPGADLRGPLDVRLRTRGALLYDWIPVVTGANPQLYGVMDLDLQLTGSLPDITVTAETHLTQLHRWKELPPSDSMPCAILFRGKLLQGGERLQVESLEASVADSHLHVSGSLDHLTSAPQLDMVVSIERSRLEDVMAVVNRLWPHTSSWNLRGRVDGMLTVQGPWKARRYGGFVGARQASLVTPSASFSLSEIAVRINRRGAVLAPMQVSLAPRVALQAQGTIVPTKLGPRYEVQLAAKGVPLHSAVLFGRGLGIRAFQALDATGSATASIHLEGSAWPLARPVITARADVRAARLYIPGLTEPLNLPHAHFQINGDQITADPVVAVLGTSVFSAKLAREGGGKNPWNFDLHANSLTLEQAALWFDALRERQPLPLLERLPGVASFASQHEKSAKLLSSLNAEGRFLTPLLSYRGVILKDFQGTFQIADGEIRMKEARFRADGGRGEAKGRVDFTTAPPPLFANVSFTGVSLQSLTARLPGRVRDIHGLVNATGRFQTRGLTRAELAQNMTGQMALRVRDISFGDFDLLENLTEQAHWGRLQPAVSPATALPVVLNMEIRDRQLIIKTTDLDLNGARLECRGSYLWSGALNLNVRADLQHLRRRWISRDDDLQPPVRRTDVRLSGPIDRLAVSSQEGVATVGSNQRFRRR